MKSKEILEKYINFYKERGHVEIPNISLIPENDPTLLFVNSGMFPLVPYLTGQAVHPAGSRVVNVQRCLRFEDLENIGKTLRHTTAFHMIGNWSFGDYFKMEQLPWVYEFLVEKLELDPNRLYATVFKGDESAPKDDESIQILKEIFKKYGIDAKEGERIFAYDKEENWWQRGEAVGELGGPDSEIFYYLGEKPISEGMNPADNDDLFLEIGNSVSLQFELTDNGWKEISQKNVDFGGGLERLALVKQEKQDIYETDNFWTIIEKIQNISQRKYDESEETKRLMRMVADHMRSSCLMAMDGVKPSNKDQGYILRRFLRKMIRAGYGLGINKDVSVSLYDEVVEILGWMYPQLEEKREEILQVFTKEEAKFRKVLEKGMRESEKLLQNFGGNENKLAHIGFDLYQSGGYPIEMFLQDIEDAGIEKNLAEIEKIYEKLVKDHQQLSREGAEQKFAGGLADQSEQTVRYHTATHLLHWALRKVLGQHVQQKGSNITGERLRFDFSHESQLSQDEIGSITRLINEKIAEKIPVNFVDMPFDEAEKTGALHFFGEKYGNVVKVYYIGESIERAFSKEFCGGPHVASTSEIGEIEIFKQKKIGEKVIRLYLRNKA